MHRYKSVGTNVIDEKGTRDTTEAMDVAQDDVLAYPEAVHHTYPVTVRENMDAVLRPFVEKSMDINMTFLSIMDDRLGMPQGTLASFNKPEDVNGSTVRLIRAAPALNPDAQTFVTAHTDFGSLVCHYPRSSQNRLDPSHRHSSITVSVDCKFSYQASKLGST